MVAAPSDNAESLRYHFPMRRLIRTIWICLLVLGLPLQGMAAATMALCAGHSTESSVATASQAHPCHGEPAAHAHQHTTPEAAAQPHKCSHCGTCAFVAAAAPAPLNLPAPLPVAEVFSPLVTQVADFAAAGPERPPRRLRA